MAKKSAISGAGEYMLKKQAGRNNKNNVNDHMLNEIENYQTSFINSDSLIAALKHDLKQQDTLIKNNPGDQELLNVINEKRHKHASDIEQLEIKFSKLKFSFNNYLSQSFNNLP